MNGQRLLSLQKALYFHMAHTLEASLHLAELAPPEEVLLLES